MATEQRSIIAYEHYQKGSERFEYFILGISMALLAYVGQTLKPERLGLSPYTLAVISILLIVVSVVLGYKRIEGITLGSRINHDILHLGETRGTFVSALDSGGFINELSDEHWTPEAIRAELARINKVVGSALSRLRACSSENPGPHARATGQDSPDLCSPRG